MMFCSALQAYQMEFSQAKDEWSRLQISGPLSIEIWAATWTQGLVPEDRRQKLSARQVLQHRQGKEEVEECSIGFWKRCFKFA
jgi:hypothetical protein